MTFEIHEEPDEGYECDECDRTVDVVVSGYETDVAVASRNVEVVGSAAGELTSTS